MHICLKITALVIKNIKICLSSVGDVSVDK